MERVDFESYQLPHSPGVYMFRGARKKLLYVGKATSLANRVRSYFSSDLIKTRGPLLVKMLTEARSMEWIETDSVLEALLLENRFIKETQPPYNTKEKDDKSYNHIVITDEQFPRVLLVRGKELSTINYKLKAGFGPFPQGSKLKEALKIIRKIFPYRDTCHPPVARRLLATGGLAGKPCFNRQIGLCPGVCTGEISARAYAQTIRHLVLFLGGNKPQLLENMRHDMASAAKRQDFERAVQLRNQLYALAHINDVALIHDETHTEEKCIRIEAFDVAHTSETARVGVMVVVEDETPNKSDYRLFNIKTKEQGDVAALTEVLERRLKHTEWPMPDMIVVDGGKAQLTIANHIVKKYGYDVAIYSVVKDERHKPKDILRADKRGQGEALTTQMEKAILLANAEAHRFAIGAHRKQLRKRLTKI